MCGTTRWKAAKASSKTMTNLDETGLEVAGCRQGIVQKAGAQKREAFSQVLSNVVKVNERLA